MLRLLFSVPNRRRPDRSENTSEQRRRLRKLLVEQLEDRKLLAAVHPLPLASLDGTNGFRMDGTDTGDESGRSVSSAGDVNGDGFDDLIIGARFGDPGGNLDAGESFVVFGKSGGFSSAISLSSLDGSNGFRIDGVDTNDRSGSSVSPAGDVNGDGFDDLIIGAYRANPGGNTAAGESYVMYGKSGPFASAISLDSLNGANGFRIDGIDAYDWSGRSLSGAGDVNGDGFDDLIIGARYADPGGNNFAGESYVIFGKSASFGSSISLSDLNGTNGFRLDGIDEMDWSGTAVSRAGDVNGDGYSDLIIGAFRADPAGIADAGESYVLFGSSGGFSASIMLSSLNGSNGFRIDGIDVDDRSGVAVSGAGDINGDGFDDLLIGAYRGDPGGMSNAGESYVIFGKSGAFASAISLASLNGFDGFRIDGVGSGILSGLSVSRAGDVNGDGLDDLIIGALFADPSGISDAGSSYLLFGKNGEFTSAISLNALNGSNGFRIDGVNLNDQSGRSAANAGDVNGDGFDDLVVGAFGADPNGNSNAGSSYMIFGGNFAGGSETQVGTGADDILSASQGPAAVDRLIGGRGNDLLVSDGGPDVLIGGQGDDVLAISDTDFSGPRRLLGGNGTDTLRLDGQGLTLDLTVIRDNRLVDIERIDLGSGRSHDLRLTAREVLNLSSHNNSLTVRGNGSRVTVLDAGWSAPNSVDRDGVMFRQYTNGSAELNIQASIAVSFAVISLNSLNGFNGFRIDGIAAFDYSGYSVASAGDINGDGFDDLFLGTRDDYSNYSYAIFGKSGGFNSAINLGNLDGIEGFRIKIGDGITTTDRFVTSLSGAGDLNGDGFDDLIIRAQPR